MIGILLCVTALLQAQDSVKSFDEFFVAGMDKIDGVFPVYVAEKEIYLEIPEKYIGREIEVSGQIDRGFDLLNRPVDGLGVVRIISPDKATICFQKPFYTERILDEKAHISSLSRCQICNLPVKVIQWWPIQKSRELLFG